MLASIASAFLVTEFRYFSFRVNFIFVEDPLFLRALLLNSFVTFVITVKLFLEFDYSNDIESPLITT